MPSLPTKGPDILTPFLKAQRDPLGFVTLFDALPGLECFVKDTQGRRLRVSSGIWKRLGFDSAAPMIGKTDHELFPPHIADQYARSDQELLKNGLPLLGIIEIWVNEQGVFDWFVINKYPVWGKNGEIIGIMGTLREASAQQKSQAPLSPLGNVVEYIRTHLHDDCTLETLTKIAGLSERQLRRRFQQEFGVGLNAFVLKARIHAAADALLQTDTAISDIALDVGFCDQSAFTRAFRERMGLTPHQYKTRYTAGAKPEPATASSRRKQRIAY
ncbi:MAG: helix-turn-helix domain-containing protein [Verrucomicrobiota bacterium]